MHITESTERLDLSAGENPVAERIRSGILKTAERQLRNFLLSPSDIPEYIDIQVRYSDTLAKIRIYTKP